MHTYKENYLKVVKKNQQVSDWDFDKILKAVNKSAKRVSKKLSEPQEQTNIDAIRGLCRIINKLHYEAENGITTYSL